MLVLGMQIHEHFREFVEYLVRDSLGEQVRNHHMSAENTRLVSLYSYFITSCKKKKVGVRDGE